MNRELVQAIRRNSLSLGLFALITAGLLASTYLGTKDRIAESLRQAAQKALLEIVPLERHDNDLLLDTLDIPANYLKTLNLADNAKLHIARDKDQPVAIIIPTVAPDGYSGAIKMVVGINIDGSIAGVRVTEHSETPGLGDKVSLRKSDWILDFNGKSLDNPTPNLWKVRKDKGEFDQFTGATITPRAVVNQVLRTLQYYNEDQERLLRSARHNQQQPSVESTPVGEVSAHE